MATYKIITTIKRGATIIKTQENEYVAPVEGIVDGETVLDAATDFEIPWVCDLSLCSFVYMVSDQDLTLETNDGTTPDDTISLIAGIPIVYEGNAAVIAALTADITKVFATNSSGEDATITLIAGMNAA